MRSWKISIVFVFETWRIQLRLYTFLLTQIIRAFNLDNRLYLLKRSHVLTLGIRD